MTAMTHQSFKRTLIKLPCLCRCKKMNFVKNIFVWVCCQYSSIPIFSEQFINFQLVRKKSQNYTRARNVRRCIRGWDSCDASHSWPIRLFPVIQFPRSGPGPAKYPSVCLQRARHLASDELLLTSTERWGHWHFLNHSKIFKNRFDWRGLPGQHNYWKHH